MKFSNDKLRRLYSAFELDSARSSAMAEMELVPYSDLVHRFCTESPGKSAETAIDSAFAVINALESRIDCTDLFVALEDGPTTQTLSSSSTIPAITQFALSTHATAYLSQSDTFSVRHSLSGHAIRRRYDAGLDDVSIPWTCRLDRYMHVETSEHVPLDETCGLKLNYKVEPRREVDVGILYADPTFSKKFLGWEAKLSVKHMCSDTWRWQSTNPSVYP